MADITSEALEQRTRSFKPFSRSALEGTIVALFRKQVSEQAGRTAVKTNSVKWSYVELDRLSNCIANTLLNARGDQLEPIAIMMSQSALAVAAILGAIKAGKIYVPLDPTEAPNQVAAKLHDAGAPIILTDAANRDTARTFATQQRTVFEVERAVATSETMDPGLSLEPDRPVYIYYTSGSTGAPKGVFDDHRNVVHNVLRYTNTLAIGSGDRMSLIQSPSYSGTVSSLFSALLNGAALHPFDLRGEGLSALSRCIRNEMLTIFHSVPSIFELLVATGDRFPSLRVIRLEGDQAFKRHVALFQANFSPPCVLVNGLGATETGLTRQFFIETDSSIPGNAVPVGFATPDMEALVLLPEGGEVSSGEVGEIAIRSRYLARGYWGRPDLTSQAFIPCPNDPEARIYRSGDLGRRDEEGCLTYLGRQDFRVKVRGQWADLEAIQELITSRPDVASAVVLSLDGGDQESKIVAYVVAKHSMGLNAKTLRRALSVEFPIHMVPASFVFLDAMPLDSNGKIARKELPPPDAACAHVEGSVVPALGELEKALAQCWCKALRRHEIGRHDNFFDHGGDSLQALELVLNIERNLDRSLSLSAIVESPTIASMAEAIRKGRPVSVAVPLPSLGMRRPFFCVHGHRGHVLQLRTLALHLGTDRPVYGIRLPTNDNHQPLVTTVEDMASLYLREVRAIQPQGPYLLGGYCFGGLIALEMAHRLVTAGEEIACLALIGTDAPGATGLPSPELWLRRHMKSLQDLPRREWPAYIMRRFLNILPVVTRRLRLHVHRRIWQICESNGRQPPVRLRTPEYVCEIASSKYEPPVLDHGNTVVFACRPEALGPTDPFHGWRDRITNGLSFCDLSATTPLVMNEPGVRELAQELRRIFDETDCG
ncbi:MAG: AMP-binding protein [Alphaproteobacteria bacterium]|nr:AMP-binding protein [Alphaproteobacteria bacterium]